MKTLKKILRWTGISVILLLVLLLAVYLIVFLITEQRIHKRYTYKEVSLTVPADSGSIEKGRHQFQIRGCEDCHGKDLGGAVFMNDPKLLQLTAPNLTRGKGGLPQNFSISDWVRVLRHGINENGRSMWVMPAHETYRMSQEDMANLIAYCTTRPRVDNDRPQMHSIGPVGRIVLLLNKAVILPAEKVDHSAVPPEKQTPQVSAGYGKYLAAGCQGCHRERMQGGPPLAPGLPEVPNISSTGDPGHWNAASFIHTLRTGITPEGRRLRPEFMPWKNMHYTDEELQAIFLYLRSLPGENRESKKD